VGGTIYAASPPSPTFQGDRFLQIPHEQILTSTSTQRGRSVLAQARRPSTFFGVNRAAPGCASSW
jgi:hypothetical protein